MTGLETAMVAARPETLAAFYQNVFGLEPEWSVEITDEAFADAGLGVPCRVVCLRTPSGQRLKFLGPGRNPRPGGSGRPVVGQVGTPLFTLVVDDLDEAVAAAEAAGGGSLGKGNVIDVGPGTRIAFLTDLEGNAVELIERAS
ncbi:VOC family protein [Actinomadura sp. KC345]|uniref:VOC family protein n=1 Tax=Actinomadura sp. KC345 TaxID=2530371 RepID=UPI00104ED2F9|nr:VOC family protein [Actinomadura sp. KC345]TDC55489.1 VOC family protein [Actinomadura sp. KC345]